MSRTDLLRRRCRPQKSLSRSAVETLEPRRLLSSFFVATSGSDTNAGTLAQPFATIQRAASVAQPGDTVFVRGGTYRETVTPAHSGAAAAPITFEPYNNEAVTLSGADPIADWSSYRGAIYRSTPPWDLGDGNNQIFVDGAMVTEARWPGPSADLFHPATASADTLTSSVTPDGPFGQTATASITSSALTQPQGALNGTTIHIAPGEGWVWQTGTVTDSGPGHLTYQYTQLLTSYQIPRAGNSFYLTGQLQMLDAPGEWFRSAAGGLYLWTAQGDSPASHSVEAKHRQYAFDLSGLSYIAVRGFNLFASTINTSASSHDVTLASLNAQYVSQETNIPDPFSTKFAAPTTGIMLRGSNIVLRDSTIGYSSGNGVAITGSNDSVQNCFIHDVDYSGGDEAGVLIAGDNNQVVQNTIWNTGRSAITDYFSGGNHVLNNVVHSFAVMTNDAGGVYTWQTNGAGTEIARNLVYDSRAPGFGNTAIFIDNGGNGFLIHHNVTWNVDSALKLSAPAHDDQVYNNTLVGVTFSLGTNYPPDMTGSIVENNILDGPIWWGPGVTQQHNFTSGDPKFANPAAGNYQLAPGSPAIDAGMVIAPFTDGFIGAAPDIGAYEFGQPPFSAGATASGTTTITPPPGATTPRSAFAQITSSSFASESGAQTNADGSVLVGVGGWVQYARLDFGAGAKLVQINLAVPGRSRGLRIQLRLDSPSGPIIATLTPHGRTLHVQSARVRGASGVHDVYGILIGRSGQVQYTWLAFTPLPVRSVRHHGRG